LTARDDHAAYRRVTVEVESVYPTDLLLRWIVRRWRAWRNR